MLSRRSLSDERGGKAAGQLSSSLIRENHKRVSRSLASEESVRERNKREKDRQECKTFLSLSHF